MKIHIYMGSFGIVEKSGVGRAILHQKELLKKKGIEVENVSLDDADIVHINTIFPDSVFAAMKAIRKGKKIVWYGHSTMEDFRNSFIGSNAFAPLFKKWITFCYSLGDIVITPTEYSKSILEGYGITKPVVSLSNGIDMEFWGEGKYTIHRRNIFMIKYHIPKDRKIVMSAGHFIERKGLPEFIELARRLTGYTFVWFGHTNMRLVPPKIRKAVENAPPNVVFAGYVDRNELKMAYHVCDLFCFMSLEETEGIVVLEALASGIPVAVRDIPVYNGWLTDGENVSKCSDNMSFAITVDRLLSQDNSLVIEKGRKTAYERDYDRIADKLIEIYRDHLHISD